MDGDSNVSAYEILRMKLKTLEIVVFGMERRNRDGLVGELPLDIL